MKPLRLSPEEALVIGLKALTFLAGDESRLARFIALSGLSLADLKAQAAKPQFLLGLLNHLLEDESLLLTFAAETELDPRLPALAAQVLGADD